MVVSMNLISFLANKYFEYLLKSDAEEETVNSCTKLDSPSPQSPSLQNHIHPPWSHNREVFRSLCDGCGECVTACESGILVLNKSGYPQVDFSLGYCNFCGQCATSCSRGAFETDALSPPWNVHAHINSKCMVKNKVVCRNCEEQCEKQAILIPRLIVIDEEPQVLKKSCNGCGACYKACPVEAIEMR